MRVENGVYEDLVVALDPTIEMDTLDLTTLQQKFQVGDAGEKECLIPWLVSVVWR